MIKPGESQIATAPGCRGNGLKFSADKFAIERQFEGRPDCACDKDRHQPRIQVRDELVATGSAILRRTHVLDFERGSTARPAFNVSTDITFAMPEPCRSPSEGFTEWWTSCGGDSTARLNEMTRVLSDSPGAVF
jgi:hypothetical protein